MQDAGVRKLLQGLKPGKLRERTTYQTGSLKNLQFSWPHLYPPYSTSPSILDAYQTTGPRPLYLLYLITGMYMRHPLPSCISNMCGVQAPRTCHMRHLLSSYQHGFREGDSCKCQIFITLDDLYCSFDKCTQVDVEVLDLFVPLRRFPIWDSWVNYHRSASLGLYRNVFRPSLQDTTHCFSPWHDTCGLIDSLAAI